MQKPGTGPPMEWRAVLPVRVEVRVGVGVGVGVRVRARARSSYRLDGRVACERALT